MTFTQFVDQLATRGKYTSREDAHINPLAKRLGRFDAWFYFIMIRYTLEGGLIASLVRLSNTGWQKLSFRILRMYETAGANVEITGMNQISDLTRPRVYVCNHMSMAETYILPSILLVKGMTSVVVKESLLRYPGLGSIVKAVEAIPVKRESPRDDLKTILTVGSERLGRGINVLVFPQSTRSTSFDPRAFNSIGAKLAARAGVDLVPIAIKTDFQAMGKLLRDFGPLDRTKTIHVKMGAPIAMPDKASAKDAHAEASAFIASAIKNWGGEVLDS